MTKSERARKDRIWLKVSHFSITQSLNDKLVQSNLTPEQQEWCCYIQNKVLMEMRQRKDTVAYIHSAYFKDKIGSGYTQWLRLLEQWEELDIDSYYLPPSGFSDGITKSYRIPHLLYRMVVSSVTLRRHLENHRTIALLIRINRK